MFIVGLLTNLIAYVDSFCEVLRSKTTCIPGTKTWICLVYIEKHDAYNSEKFANFHREIKNELIEWEG